MNARTHLCRPLQNLGESKRPRGPGHCRLHTGPRLGPGGAEAPEAPAVGARPVAPRATGNDSELRLPLAADKPPDWAQRASGAGGDDPGPSQAAVLGSC